MKKIKWLSAVLAVVFGLIQLVNPACTNPPAVNGFILTNVPTPVAASLRAACYDCHSHETKWPWYSRIAPVSWLVAGDVNEGRRHLNFSAWPTDPAAIAKKLDRINEVLGYHEMPPKKYTLLHPEARLTETQLRQLMDWSDAAARQLNPESTNQ